MDAKLQRRVQRYGWDKAAAYYEHSWQSQLEPAQSALLELASLKPGIQVLDVACGTGLVTLKAAAAIGPAGKIVGTDISEQMVLAARDIAAGREATNISFERMDAEQSAFGDNSFDVVLCALGLMYVPDPKRRYATSIECFGRGGAPYAPSGASGARWMGRNFPYR